MRLQLLCALVIAAGCETGTMQESQPMPGLALETSAPDADGDFLAAVREARKAGTSADDMTKSWKISEKYKGYTDPQPARLKSNIEVILAELK